MTINKEDYNELKHNYIICTDTGAMEFCGVGEGSIAIFRINNLKEKYPGLSFDTVRVTSVVNGSSGWKFPYADT